MRKLILIASTIMLFSYTDVISYIPFTVEGIVKDKASGKPIKYVHVFTTKGEEEAVTDEKGVFRFESWRETAVLTTEKEGYRRSEQTVRLPLSRQTILLVKE